MNRKPSPEDFGLPHNVEEYIETKRKEFNNNWKSHNTKGVLLSSVLLFIVITVAGGVITLILNVIFDATVSVFDFGLPLAIVLSLLNLLQIFAFSKPSTTDFWDTKEYQNYRKYNEAVRKYEHDVQIKKESFWKNLSGHEFEDEVAALYRRQGYNAKVSKQGGDGGVDIVLEKNGERIAVQCKAHKNPVSPAVIRDLYGTMISKNYHKGLLVSLNGFTSGTKSFAAGKPIQLIELKDLIKMTDSFR